MIIPVNMTAESYDIVLEAGALNRVGEELNLNRRVLIVTGELVPKAYSETVAAQCKTPVIATVPKGEASKCFEQLQFLLKTMLDNGFTRKDCVVAVGGGVIGDLSAFAASIYMRGIDFYNIPTTLLSQVDSSIGGKTAIDYEGVKNVIGTFYQPKKVIIDPNTLKTLSPRLIHAGLAESIKMAATSDAELFELIEKSTDLDTDLTEIIRRSLLIKKNVVEIDPNEKGLRKVLNFGHTIGHAVEGFNGDKYYHGECVALGMLPLCTKQVRERLIKVLKKYDLPTVIEQSRDELLPYVLHDKKMQADFVTIVYVEEIGSFKFVDVKPTELLGYLEY